MLKKIFVYVVIINVLLVSCATTKGESSLSSNTATRYVAEDGLFMIGKPATWSLLNNTMSKYKTIKAPNEFGLSTTVTFAAEEYNGSLSEYNSQFIEVLKYFGIDDINIIEKPARFMTKSGLRGMKMALEYDLNGLFCWQILYTFEGKRTTKIAVSCLITLVDWYEYAKFLQNGELLEKLHQKYGDNYTNDSLPFFEIMEISDDMLWSFTLL